MRLCLACWSVRHTTLFYQMTFIVQFVSRGPIGRPAGITSSAAQTCSVREQERVACRWRFCRRLLMSVTICGRYLAASATAIVFGEAHPSRSARLPTPNAFASKNTPGPVSKVLLTRIRLSVYVTPWLYLKVLRLRFFSKRCLIRHGCVC